MQVVSIAFVKATVGWSYHVEIVGVDGKVERSFWGTQRTKLADSVSVGQLYDVLHCTAREVMTQGHLPWLYIPEVTQ